MLNVHFFTVHCFLKISSRDKEIGRLTSLLEGGRSSQVVTGDCCYKDTEGRLSKMQDEINKLKHEKLKLEDNLKGILIYTTYFCP